MTSPEVFSCSSSIFSVLLSPSHSTLSSRNIINTYKPQKNMCYQRRSSPKHPVSESGSVTSIVVYSDLCKPLHINIADELILILLFIFLELSFDSNDDFSSSQSPDVLNNEILLH